MNQVKLGFAAVLIFLSALSGFAQNGIGKHDFYGKKAASPSDANTTMDFISILETPDKGEDKGYKIQKMGFNSNYSDMCPVIYGGGLVFSSARKRGFFTRVMDRNASGYFYDLYFVPLNQLDAKPKLLKGKVNTRFHDGPATVTKDGKLMYFTRSNFVDGKFRRSADGVNKLKVFSADNNGKKWKDIKNLDFNSDEYTVAHPTVSPDGNILYFTSDMPGGFGGYDIWMVKKNEKGEWSKPSNLGSRINTSKNEYFPNVHDSGVLFFSSDGHKGQGGLDIFYARGEGFAWDPPVNMGDLNSAKDDFGITWVKNKPSGYFSSDREGSDNIYSFEKKLTIEIEVLQAASGMKLPGAKVKITDMNNKQTRLETDNLGRVQIFGRLNQEYLVEVERDYHEPVKQRFSTRNMSPVENKLITVELVREYRLIGRLRDAENGSSLSGVNVRMIQGYTENAKTSDAKGMHTWKLEGDTDYTLIISKDGYIPEIVNVTTKGRKAVEDIILNTQMTRGAAVLAEGSTKSKTTGKGINEVNVRAIDLAKEEEYKATTSMHGGRFWMVLDTGANYSMIGSAKNYFATRVEVPVKDSSMVNVTTQVDIEMIDSKVGEIVSIIYFDYNKSDITKSSSRELFEIVYFLKDNPSAEVELGAYTDSRGGDSFNKRLSQYRADQAVNYIVKKGKISNSRISAGGYGEDKVVNKCVDGTECTEEEHALNRRAEIKVTKLNGQSSTDSNVPDSNK